MVENFPIGALQNKINIDKMCKKLNLSSSTSSLQEKSVVFMGDE
jgi:hypothetical protein